MNIGVIGGGSRCLYLMNFIAQYKFQVIAPNIVAVADIRPEAPGYAKAESLGLFVTTDYNDLLSRDDIDLLVELTGDLAIYNDIIAKKKPHVRAIAHTTAVLFWEIASIARREEATSLKLNEAKTIYEVMINELIQEDVLVIDMDYRITDINDTMLSRLGLRREEAIGHFCYEITHHQDKPCTGDHHPCPLAQTVKTRKPSKTTHVHLDKNGNELYYAISCYPIIKKGELMGVFEISSDITRDIRRQKNMMQQEKLMSIGRLSAGIAHEINNPLTTILTSAILMTEDMEPDNPLYAELDIITKEALRCRNIVKSLLDFARQSPPVKQYLDLNRIVSDTVFLVQKQAAFDDIRLLSEPGPDLPPLWVDKDQIQQALINLILNAIEATPAGGRITLSTEMTADTARLKVRDTGRGIPPEHLTKIFDPFFTTRDTGTGLGLSITHGIVAQHGGAITVESAPGQGTTFTISLPLQREEPHVP